MDYNSLECPKCGHTYNNVRYIEDENVLVLKCSQCQFERKENPADNKTLSRAAEKKLLDDLNSQRLQSWGYEKALKHVVEVLVDKIEILSEDDGT